MIIDEIDAYMERELSSDFYCERHYYDNQIKVEGVPINPVLRYYFDSTPNEDRNKKEMADWFDMPYIVTRCFVRDTYKEYLSRMGESDTIQTKEEWESERTLRIIDWNSEWKEGLIYVVRCLNGGAWDRSSNLGHFDNLDDALSFAKSY